MVLFEFCGKHKDQELACFLAGVMNMRLGKTFCRVDRNAEGALQIITVSVNEAKHQRARDIAHGVSCCIAYAELMSDLSEKGNGNGGKTRED